MSKARHHKKDEHEMRARGGKAMIDAGREKEEEDEMEAGHKKGGRVARKKGGPVEHGEGMKPMRSRLDRPGRKRGGGVGADMHPLSTAAKTQDAEGHKTGESGEARENPEDG